MSGSTRSFLLLGLAGALAGCVHQRWSQREVGSTAAPEPRSVAYSIPAEAPKGQVYVVSLGRVAFQNGQSGPAPYLHLRLAAQNDSDQVLWRLDPNEQVVRFDGGAPISAAYAKASTESPVLSLQAGQRGHLDLYYPLPGTAGLPQIALEWRLARGEVLVANTTSFERARDRSYAYYEPVYTPRVGVHLRMGPAWWWHDPFWPYYDAPWGWSPYYYSPFYSWQHWHHRPHYYGPVPRQSYPRSSGGSWRAPPAGRASPAPSAPAPAPSRSGDSGKSGWRGGGR